MGCFNRLFITFYESCKGELLKGKKSQTLKKSEMPQKAKINVAASGERILIFHSVLGKLPNRQHPQKNGPFKTYFWVF